MSELALSACLHLMCAWRSDIQWPGQLHLATCQCVFLFHFL